MSSTPPPFAAPADEMVLLQPGVVSDDVIASSPADDPSHQQQQNHQPFGFADDTPSDDVPVATSSYSSAREQREAAAREKAAEYQQQFHLQQLQQEHQQQIEQQQQQQQFLLSSHSHFSHAAGIELPASPTPTPPPNKQLLRHASASISQRSKSKSKSQHVTEEEEAAALLSPSATVASEQNEKDEEEEEKHIEQKKAARVASMLSQHADEAAVMLPESSPATPTPDYQHKKEKEDEEEEVEVQEEETPAAVPASTTAIKRVASMLSQHADEAAVPLPMSSTPSPKSQQQQSLRSRHEHQRKASSSTSSSKLSQHPEEAAVELPLSPSLTPPPVVATAEEVTIPDSPIPTFTRPTRHYMPILDSATELDRIRTSKDYESEFEEFSLPTLNTDSVHALIDEEAACALPTVDDSSLMNDLLGVGRLTYEEMQHVESELEYERLEEMEEELQRSTRRELELQAFQHNLLLSHQILASDRASEYAQKEEEYYLQTKKLIAEEQQSFRKMEEEMREYMKDRKNGKLQVKHRNVVSGEDGEDDDGDNNNSSSKTLSSQIVPGEKESKNGSSDKDSDNSNNTDSLLSRSESQLRSLYSRIRSRTYTISWSYEPRLLRIRCDWLRCLKNKLPQGEYNMMITLYDRLGGKAMRWSGGGENGINSTGATRVPQYHSGKFYSLDLSFAQTQNRIFLACPSALVATPSMVLIFELFLMGEIPSVTGNTNVNTAGNNNNSTTTTPSRDRVVGWGAFPLQCSDSSLLSGSYKLPLLRGTYGEEVIEKYSTIHDKITSNLDNWLGNLYFDVKKWKKVLDKEKTTDVEMRYKSGEKDGSRIDEEDEDEDDEQEEEEDPAPFNEHTVAPLHTQKKLHGAHDHLPVLHGELNLDALEEEEDALVHHHELQQNLTASQRNGMTAPLNSHRMAMQKSSGASGGEKLTIDLTQELARQHQQQQEHQKNSSSSTSATPNPTTVTSHLSLHLHTHYHDRKVVDQPDTNEEQLTEMRNGRKKRVGDGGSGGGGEKRYRYNVNVEDGGKNGAAAADDDIASDDSSSSTSNTFHPLGSLASYKLRYIWNEIALNLNITHFRTACEFVIIFLIFSLWLRIYTHYLGEYLFLSSKNIPITKYNCKLYTCDLFYSASPDDISVQTQIGVVVIGTIMNLLIQTVLIVITAVVQVILGRVPHFVSKLLFNWCLGTIIEPLLILFIDICQSNWIRGDSFKLYAYYRDADTLNSNGVAGIFMTILLTALLILFTTIQFYFYLIHIHMNGRILDIHSRLKGTENSFHLPHDLEISVRELRWILIKASRWIGLGGQKRKVTVSKFRVKDPLRVRVMPDGRRVAVEEVSIYIAIYTQSLTGDIELFRHFYRSAHGGIIELFDTFDAPQGESEFKRIEERLATHEKRQQAMQSLEYTSTKKQPSLLPQKSLGSTSTGPLPMRRPSVLKMNSTSLLNTTLLNNHNKQSNTPLTPTTGTGSPMIPSTPISSGPSGAKGRFKQLSSGLRRGSFGLAGLSEK